MDLNEILVFVKVAEAQSFTLAGQRLDMPKSTVSLRLARLEERLGVRLLHRTTRKLRLTDEGGLFLERCRRIIEDIAEAERALRQETEQPRGHLKITAPVEFGLAFLGPWVARYLQVHPDTSIEVDLTSRMVDLVEEGYDLAIRAGNLAASSQIATRLGTVGRHLYASPAYLQRHGAPPTPAALKDHICLGHRSLSGPQGLPLAFGAETYLLRAEFRLVANSFAMLRDAAAHGLGIAVIPDFVCREAVARGALVRVLPAWSVSPADIFVVYPTRRQMASRVRSFLAFLRSELAQVTEAEPPAPVV